MLSFTRVSMGEGSAITCRACGVSPSLSHRDTDEAAAEVARAVASASGAANLALSGGEPLVHPGLWTVLSAAREAGATRIRVETAGDPSGVDDVAGRLLEAGVRHLRVRVTAGSADSSDRLTVESGYLGAALGVLGDFLAASSRMDVQVALSGAILVCKHNLSELPLAIGELVAAGATAVSLQVAPGLAEREAIPWLLAACDTGAVNCAWVSVEGTELPPTHRLHSLRQVGGMLAAAGE